MLIIIGRNKVLAPGFLSLENLPLKLLVRKLLFFNTCPINLTFLIAIFSPFKLLVCFPVYPIPQPFSNRVATQEPHGNKQFILFALYVFSVILLYVSIFYTVQSDGMKSTSNVGCKNVASGWCSTHRSLSLGQTFERKTYLSKDDTKIIIYKNYYDRIRRNLELLGLQYKRSSRFFENYLM